jgi:predicted O-methyltransferase YrrM
MARRLQHHEALDAQTRPDSLARLLELAAGRRNVVEIGTAAAWSSISLALADRRRRVTTHDRWVWAGRAEYLGLVGRRTRSRITFVQAPGEASAGVHDVDFLFIDGSHERHETEETFRTWRPALARDAIVAFHDYGPEYPGVAEAVEDLGLEGDILADTFVWRAGGGAPRG